MVLRLASPPPVFVFSLVPDWFLYQRIVIYPFFLVEIFISLSATNILPFEAPPTHNTVLHRRRP